MGFDEFLNQDNWGGEYQDKLRGFVSDQSVFDKIISLYKEKETNQKLFTFCVTMQNHGGYAMSYTNLHRKFMYQHVNGLPQSQPLSVSGKTSSDELSAN